MRTRGWLLPAALIATTALLSCSRDPAADPPATPPAQHVRALAQAKAEWPELTIEVLEVRPVGGTLLVRFRFVNTSAQPFEFGDRFAAQPGDRDSLADVALLDPSGRRKSFVLRDRANQPQCSAGQSPLEPGEKRLLFARFPAPLAGTSRITIQVPHVPEMREVPVAAASGPNGPGGV